MEKVLFHFKEVALHGSISLASERLGVTQPAISKSIKLLEERYQTRLLDRQPRGVKLTPAGKIVLERALRIENEMVAIEQDIGSLLSEKEVLRIGAGPAWEQPINDVIPAFFLKYPNIKLDIQSNTISKFIPMLINNELDLAFGGEDGQLLVNNNELSSCFAGLR